MKSLPTVSKLVLELAVLLVVMTTWAFAQSGTVVVSSNTTWAAGSYQLDSLTVNSGATLTVGGGSTITVGGAVLVTGNSNIVLEGANTSAQVNGTWQGIWGDLKAASVEVDAGSSINGDGQGYLANDGPGGAPSGSSAGGSYGGLGGTGFGPVPPAPIYGSGRERPGRAADHDVAPGAAFEQERVDNHIERQTGERQYCREQIGRPPEQTERADHQPEGELQRLPGRDRLRHRRPLRGPAHPEVEVSFQDHIDRVGRAGGHVETDGNGQVDPRPGPRPDLSTGSDEHRGHGGEQEEADHPRLGQRQVISPRGAGERMWSRRPGGRLFRRAQRRQLELRNAIAERRRGEKDEGDPEQVRARQVIDMVANTFMRAPGESIGTFALESALDELAAQLHLDPIELRRRIEPKRDPTTGLPFSQRNLLEAYERGARQFGWAKRSSTPRSQRDGDWLVGQGVATAIYPYYRMPGGAAKIRLTADGRAVIQMGSHEMGMGTATVQAQVAAEKLGLAVDRVTFEYGDSALPNGTVAGGSSQSATIVAAVTAAAEGLFKELLRLAGKTLAVGRARANAGRGA